MILPIPSLHPYILALIITVTLLALIFAIFIVIYLYIHRSRRQDDTEVILTEMNVVNSSPNRFSYPLTTVSHANHETLPTQLTLNELPSNYRTFDFTKRARLHESSDSSYSGSTYRSAPLQSFSFGTIKSKFQESNNSERVSTVPSSDCDDIDTQSFAPVPPTIEYSLLEIFRIELVYKLSYSPDNNELLLQIIRITPMHPLIEHCFPSFSCQIRLFNNDDKHKTKKYLSKKDSTNSNFYNDMN